MRISSGIRFSQVYDNYEDTKNIEPSVLNSQWLDVFKL